MKIERFKDYLDSIDKDEAISLKYHILEKLSMEISNGILEVMIAKEKLQLIDQKLNGKQLSFDFQEQTTTVSE